MTMNLDLTDAETRALLNVLIGGFAMGQGPRSRARQPGCVHLPVIAPPASGLGTPSNCPFPLMTPSRFAAVTYNM
jgi:hypothetical protein